MRIRDRIVLGVRTRLEMVTPHIGMGILERCFGKPYVLQIV